MPGARSAAGKPERPGLGRGAQRDDRDRRAAAAPDRCSSMTSRSMPPAQPMPAVGGPPSSAISPS